MESESKISSSGNKWTLSAVSQTNRHWSTWHLLIKGWELPTHLVATCPKVFLRTLWRMSMARRMRCTLSQGREALDKLISMPKCIHCSRSQSMDMFFREILAITKGYLNNILTLRHSQLRLLQASLVLVGHFRAHSTIPTNVRHSVTECEHSFIIFFGYVDFINAF
jgi:hypothetical protein